MSQMEEDDADRKQKNSIPIPPFPLSPSAASLRPRRFQFLGGTRLTAEDAEVAEGKKERKGRNSIPIQSVSICLICGHLRFVFSSEAHTSRNLTQMSQMEEDDADKRQKNCDFCSPFFFVSLRGFSASSAVQFLRKRLTAEAQSTPRRRKEFQFPSLLSAFICSYLRPFAFRFLFRAWYS